MDWLLKPFGSVLKFFNDITGSYLIAILIFAVLVKILMLPLSIKQQKNQVKQASLRPKETAIRKKYKDATTPEQQRKMQEELNDLYQKEGFNPMGGCLPLLIQLPIIIGLYSIIRSPIKYICGVAADGVTKLLDAAKSLGFLTEKATDLDLVSALKNNFDAITEKAGVTFDFNSLPDFSLFGIADLSITPSFDKEGLPYLIIPVLTGIISFISAKLTKKLSGQSQVRTGAAEDAAAKTSGLIMDLMMPLMSVWICFMFPALLGVYWIFQNILGIAQQYLLKLVYPYPVFTEEDYKQAEREINGKGSKKKAKNSLSARPAPAPGVYRSLHHIDDDEVYEVPDTSKKRPSAEAPKLKEDNPDHRKKS